MFRPAARAAVRAASSSSFTLAARRIPTRRWASTAADKPWSWKGGALRWGLAGAIVYYYSTSNVFAEESNEQYAHYPPPVTAEPEELRTLDSYAKQPPTTQTSSTPIAADGELAPAPSGGAQELEAEASQQGAFNEETGEINWDCSCLGGMAYGPCGEEFRAAFSCFVYSQEEPKGVDCIEKFKGMQDCFRAHPDVYAAELEDDEEPGAIEQGEGAPALAKDAPSESVAGTDAAPAPVTAEPSSNIADEKSATDAITEPVKAVGNEIKATPEPKSESETLVPKAAHDARDAQPSQQKSQA